MFHKKFREKCLLLVCIMIIVLIAVSSYILFWAFISGRNSSDFGVHIATALNGRPGYSLAHLLIKICYCFDNNGKVLTIMMVVLTVATMFLIFAYLISVLAPCINTYKVFLVACSVIFTSNIYLPGIFPHLYNHYTKVSQPLHNITYILMRMWSVAVIYIWFKLLRQIQDNQTLEKKKLLLFGLGLLLCNYSKPNFILAFAPVVGVTCIIYLVRFRFTNWSSILQVGIVGIVSILPLYFQTKIVFAEEENSSIALSAENLFDYLYGGGDANFFVYEVSNLLFPLFVLTVLIIVRFVKKTRIDFSRIIQAASIYFVAHLQQLIMIENGWRKNHWNFAWGVYGAGMLLFMVFITEWIYVYTNKKISSKIYIAGNAIYLFHIVSGIVYYCLLVMEHEFLI